MEHVGEKSSGVQYDLFDGLQNLLGGQLHDLAAQIDDPDQLFGLPEYSLAEMQQSLVDISDEFFLLQDFVQSLDFDVAYPVHHHCLARSVPSAHPVLVDSFDRLDFGFGDYVLGGGGGTWYSCLKCRKRGSCSVFWERW